MPAQRLALACRDQAHFQQEQGQHAFEEVKEQRFERDNAVRSGRPADCQPAHKQHDTLAEEYLVCEPAPARAAADTAGEHDTDDDSRDLEQYEKQRHLRIVRDASRAEKRHTDGKGRDADGAIVCRYRCGIGTTKATEYAGHRKHEQRQHQAHGKHRSICGRSPENGLFASSTPPLRPMASSSSMLRSS